MLGETTRQVHHFLPHLATCSNTWEVSSNNESMSSSTMNLAYSLTLPLGADTGKVSRGNSEYWVILKISPLLQLYKQLPSNIAHTGRSSR